MKTSFIIDSHSCNSCAGCTQKKCKKSGDCCKHSKEYVKLKVDQNHSGGHAGFTPQLVAIVDVFLSRYTFGSADAVEKEPYPVTNAPPLGAQNPIHILNCTYLI